MTFVLMPGTVLHELVALRPIEQAQVLGLLLERWRTGEQEIHWAERLTIDSCWLSWEKIQRPSEDLLKELSRDRWQGPLKDCFRKAVGLRKIPEACVLPGVFGFEQAVDRLAALQRSVPRLIDRMVSCILLATSENLEFRDRSVLKAWINEARRDLEHLRREVSELKRGAVRLRSWDPADFGTALSETAAVLDRFDVIALRRQPGEKEELSRTLLRAARAFDPRFGSLLEDKFSDPGFAGSEREMSLMDVLGLFPNWPVPEGL